MAGGASTSADRSRLVNRPRRLKFPQTHLDGARAGGVANIMNRGAMQPTAEQLRDIVQVHYGVDVDPIPLAAIGLTLRVWRRSENQEAEMAHMEGTISNSEMFAANVATTRLAQIFWRRFPDMDWDGLADAIVDPSRCAGGRTIAGLLGHRYPAWAWDAHSLVLTQGDLAADNGLDWVLWMNAATSDSRWWGSPGWPQRVDRVFAKQSESPAGESLGTMKATFLNAPDDLPVEQLEWFLRQEQVHRL